VNETKLPPASETTKHGRLKPTTLGMRSTRYNTDM